MKTLVCIGDSLVEGEGDELSLGGWPGRVARMLTPNTGRKMPGWQVYNLGIGGDSIQDVNSRLGEALLRNPDVLVIGCGANDVAPDAQVKHTLELRHAVWENVLRKAKGMTPNVLVLSGFCSRDTTVYAANWRKDYAHAFAEHENAVMALCDKFGVTFIQLSKDFAEPDILCDGLHYNARGYDVLAQMVFEVLNDNMCCMKE